MAERTPAENRDLQRTLNRFTNKYLENVEPLIVDGDKGHATNRRIMTAKYFLGYGSNRNGSVSPEFVRRVRHPHSRDYSPATMLAAGAKRRRQQRLHERANSIAGKFAPGVGSFDGRPVAKCAIPYLEYARAHGWEGGLNSGWRNPLYSRSLCINMCGAPSCPGKCAGTSSNHVGSTCDNFAIDVSDYVRFGQIMKSMPIPPGKHQIWNALGSRDPVHFSPSGR